MPRAMSFALTKDQLRAGTKTVTRRLGWAALKPGDALWAVEKAQGLKKGERQRKIAMIRVLSVRQEVLINMAVGDLAREGFPGMGIGKFVSMFCSANKCQPSTVVQRIEFEIMAPACEILGHDWKEKGGRACPANMTDCSQSVYVCDRCGEWDYGNEGGPAHAECGQCEVMKEQERKP
jgi:hypothetical protein